MYSANSVLLVFIIFPSRMFVNCLITTPLNDSYIVNAINNYRNDLACSYAFQNMRLISSSKELVAYANDFMNNQIERHRNASLLKITAQTCGYKLFAGLSLKTKVQRFIQKCIHQIKIKESSNSDLSWLWDPQYTKIGCAFSSMGTYFILCVVNKTEIQTVNLQAKLLIDSSKHETDLWKQNGALFTNKCRRVERHKYKTCYLLASTRDYIKNEVNRYRKNLVRENGYDDLTEVKWDPALEMATIEISKFNPITLSDNCFTVESHSNGFVIEEFTPNNHFLVQPYLNPEIIQFIADSDNSNRGLYAIGCTYFNAEHKTILLCMWNKDHTIILTVKFWARKVLRYCIVNPYLVYVMIVVAIFDVVIVILFIKTLHRVSLKKASRRVSVADSLYAVPNHCR